jgi:ubiquinone biosynthesis protein
MAGRSILYHYRHWRRYQEIMNALVRHGFSFIIERLDLPGAPLASRLRKGLIPPEDQLSRLPRQIVAVLKELGPTFIKLGQMLSTRPDMLPSAYITELSKLQDQVPSFSYNEVEEIFADEEGENISDVFTFFDHQALASASIGQVHRARLQSGEEVVVKVQRPGIEPRIRVDLEILMEICHIVQQRTRFGAIYNIPGMLEEFSTSLLEELDFNLEGRNAEIFQKNFADDGNVCIPGVYWQYTKRRVLVLEYIKGRKIAGRRELIEAGFDPQAIARNLVDAMIKQIYRDGFFHSDPHPGNLSVLAGNQVVFMDFGQVGQIDEVLREQAADLVLALAKHDLDGIIKALLHIGIVRGQPNMARLRRDMSRLERKYYGRPLKEISLATSVYEIFEVAWHYQIDIPLDFVMTAKACITLEGVIRELSPEMSLVEIAEPFATRVITQRYNPGRIQKRLWRDMVEMSGSIMRLPGLVEDLATRLQRGDVKLTVQQQDFPLAIGQLRRSVTRLAISIIIASVLIASSLLMKIDPSSILIRYHICEMVLVITFGTSFLLISVLFFDSRH